MTLRAMSNLCYSMVLDSPALLFNGEEREKIVRLLSWPDDELTTSASDAQARQAASALGLANPDVLVQRALEARSAAGVD